MKPFLVILALVLMFTGSAALAQEAYGPPANPEALLMQSPAQAVIGSLPRLGPSDDPLNPLALLAGAANAMPGNRNDGGEAGAGDGAEGLSAALNVLILLTVIALAPSIMLMTTCFLRIVIVLGLLKQALGTQQLPPPQVIVSLSLFMTLLVMSPTIDRINNEAIAPYRAGEIRDYDTLWDRAKMPMRDFMFAQIRATGNWSSVYMVLNYRGIDTSEPDKLTEADVDMISLIPAYMLSELRVAFLMGFRVYLPFLVIDMVIASLLISMSMMMLPPVLISLPFKLLLFVLVDGWQLIVSSLLTSFVTDRPVVITAVPPELSSVLEALTTAATVLPTG